jgi:hypothetical protein
MENENKDMMQEPQPDYEKAELDLLRDALKRNYKERFLMATRLYKIQKTISKAKIIRKPYILPR